MSWMEKVIDQMIEYREFSVFEDFLNSIKVGDAFFYLSQIKGNFVINTNGVVTVPPYKKDDPDAPRELWIVTSQKEANYYKDSYVSDLFRHGPLTGMVFTSRCRAKEAMEKLKEIYRDTPEWDEHAEGLQYLKSIQGDWWIECE